MNATTGDEHTVRFGLGVPNGGDFADPQRLTRLASEAELAGWDGFFLWDHVIRRRPWQPMVDPWVSLAAVAVATDRIVLAECKSGATVAGDFFTNIERLRTLLEFRDDPVLVERLQQLPTGDGVLTESR